MFRILRNKQFLIGLVTGYIVVPMVAARVPVVAQLRAKLPS
jgi:hypothetical protein